jgi:hypothetical protein
MHCHAVCMDDKTMLMDGASYHFRHWPDDGETFEFRGVEPGGAGVLVNLTNPGEANDFWVHADGGIWTKAGHRISDVSELAAGLSDTLARPATRV